MTEQQWLACADVTKMVSEHPLRAGPRVSDRTLRLLTVAALLPLWDHLGEERSRQAVHTLERYAEGKSTREELATAAEEAHAAVDEVRNRADQVAAEAVATALGYDRPFLPGLGWLLDGSPDGTIGNARSNYLAVLMFAASAITVSLFGMNAGYSQLREGVHAEIARQADMLRDVLGNPFRPVAANPAWLTPTARSMAEAVYEQHAFDRTPVLADNLEETGCDDAAMLAHCRMAGAHVRGCWVLDLVLAKEGLARDLPEGLMA